LSQQRNTQSQRTKQQNRKIEGVHQYIYYNSYTVIMLFSPILRHRSVPLLLSKTAAIQKLSLPSVTGAVQNHQYIAERAMAGTAQSQTSAVRKNISLWIYSLISEAISNCFFVLIPLHS
jgi:hypothetical protein